MSKRKIQVGSIFEIQLINGKFAYGCWFRNFVVGIYDVLSEKRLDFEVVSKVPFRAYMACNDTAINKGIWIVIGVVPLSEDEAYAPDRAYYAEWLPEDSIEKSEINRRGARIRVSNDYYAELVNKGLISAAFDRPEALSRWIVDHLKNWPDYEPVLNIADKK